MIASLQECVQPYRKLQVKITNNRKLLKSEREKKIADLAFYSEAERNLLDRIVADGLREIARYKTAKDELLWLQCVDAHPRNLESCSTQ